MRCKKTDKGEGRIESGNKIYPNGERTKKIATILEFSQQGSLPQPHFRNTEKRNLNNVKEIIKKAINLKFL